MVKEYDVIKRNIDSIFRKENELKEYVLIKNDGYIV